MIDLRHGFAIARKIEGTYHVLTDRRPRSTVVLINANLEPIRRRKLELEEEGVAGLVLVRIVDNLIIEIEDDRAVKPADDS